MLYGKKGAGVKAGTQQNTRPSQRPDWRFRLVQKQQQGTERAKRSAALNEFFETHQVSPDLVLKRHAEHAALPEPTPKPRRRVSSTPLQSHKVVRDGVEMIVQTSTPRVLRPATLGMKAMGRVLLTSGEVEVKEAA